MGRSCHGANHAHQRGQRHERALASVTVLDGVGLDARRNADSKAHLWAAADVIDM